MPYQPPNRKKTRRNKAIYRAYLAGTSVTALARRYKLSHQRICQLIDDQQKLAGAAPSTPPADPPPIPEPFAGLL